MTDKIYVWDNGGCEGREHFVASSDEVDPHYAETAEPGAAYLRATPERLAAEDMLKALRDVLPSLVAAVSLLEKGGKKAAPSDKMFDQMIADYKASIERGRAAYMKATDAGERHD